MSTTEDKLHILPTDVRLTCPTFMEKTGPTRQSTQEEVVIQSKMHRPPRSQQRHNLLKEVTTTSLSILILSKSYPTMVYT